MINLHTQKEQEPYMNKKNNSSPDIQEEDMFTPEGLPSDIAKEELDKYIAQTYGKVKIISHGKCISEVIEGILDPEDKKTI